MDPEEKMSDYQGRLLRVLGTQTAASGVLAISLQKPVIFAAALCLQGSPIANLMLFGSL